MDLLGASEVKVSVICMAYNQEKYIEQMLRSVITQKTEFRFEVIVHDDCSIDATADIIKKYQNEYPDIVRPIYESENQYSQECIRFARYRLPAGSGAVHQPIV